MNQRLEAWVRSHPRTCIYLVVITTINFLLNLWEVLHG